MGIPETRYAKTEDGVHIAYQVLGDGPVDLVYVPGYASHLEYAWGLPLLARYYRRLSTFSRLILIDRAGTGLSDRVLEREVPTLESRMEDVRAVLHEVDSARAAFIGEFGTGAMCALFAATYPERSVALVLLSTFVRGTQAPDYPWAWDRDEWRDAHRWVEQAWGTEGFVRQHAVRWAPSLAEDAAFARWYAGLLRIAASPATALAIERVEEETDVRDVLHTIAVPTLVCGCTSNPDFPLDEQRFITSRIPGARLVELEGANALPWAGDQDALLGEIEAFLRRVRAEEVEFDRVLATVLFTDIVGSTAKAAELADRGWRDLVERHHSAVRANLVRYRGKEAGTAGDGFFATFDGPARAVRCAQAIVEAVKTLGLEIRAGLHTGEVETIDNKVGGIAVNIGARVGALAGPSQILVSSTVKDLTAGSGLVFEDAGEHELKGVPDRWRLYRVASERA